MEPLETIWPVFGLRLTTPRIWEHRIQANPGSWVIMFGVSTRDGDFLDTQDVASKGFPSLRTISTGSWLRRSAQGQGLGKEMRAAILLWAFDHLGADGAMTSAYDWNSSSIGVSIPRRPIELTGSRFT